MPCHICAHQGVAQSISQSVNASGLCVELSDEHGDGLLVASPIVALAGNQGYGAMLRSCRASRADPEAPLLQGRALEMLDE